MTLLHRLSNPPFLNNLFSPHPVIEANAYPGRIFFFDGRRDTVLTPALRGGDFRSTLLVLLWIFRHAFVEAIDLWVRSLVSPPSVRINAFPLLQ